MINFLFVFVLDNSQVEWNLICSSCENYLIPFHRMACVYAPHPPPPPGYSTNIWV